MIDVTSPSSRVTTNWTDDGTRKAREEPQQKKQDAVDLGALRRSLSEIQAVWPAAAGALAQHIFMSPKRIVAKPQHWHQSERPTLGSLSVGDTGVQLYSWGHAPWVLLVHGWNGNAASMSKFVDPIRDRGYGVIAFDAPAHGSSEGETTTMGGFAAVCRQLYRQHTNFVAIVGHSIGGPAAILALEDFPDINPKLVLISAPCESGHAITLFSQVFGLNEATDANVRRRLAVEVGCPIEDISLAKMRASRLNPVLLVHDEGDRVMPISEALKSLKALPQARLHRTQGLGHERIVSDGEVLSLVAESIGARLPLSGPRSKL